MHRKGAYLSLTVFQSHISMSPALTSGQAPVSNKRMEFAFRVSMPGNWKPIQPEVHYWGPLPHQFVQSSLQ